jgi:hypothetical protein
MKIQAPDPQPRHDGEYHTWVNGIAYGAPYGVIYLDEGRALALQGITLDDARRLAVAAARVERQLAAAHAQMAASHGRGYIYEGTCQLCGKPEGDGLHAEPAIAAADDEPLPDCAAPGCGHGEHAHYRPQDGPLAKGPCADCACPAYALPQDETAAAR